MEMAYLAFALSDCISSEKEEGSSTSATQSDKTNGRGKVHNPLMITQYFKEEKKKKKKCAVRKACIEPIISPITMPWLQGKIVECYRLNISPSKNVGVH